MGYVYKFTNKINHKWYIGSHKGNKENYLGSGKAFAAAKKKYGIENFKKEILYEGKDFRKQEEKILKELDAANDFMSYNLKNESLGGSFFGKNNGMYGKRHSQKTKEKIASFLKNKKRPDHSKKMLGENNPMFGKNYQTYGLIKRSKENIGKTFEEIHGSEKAKKIKEKISINHKGKKHKLKTVICPFCNKSGKGPNMTRYHFDKCKNRKSMKK